MKIEKSVPLPTAKSGFKQCKYNWDQLEVGDSVFFPGERLYGKPYNSAHQYGKYHGLKFTVRTVDGGIRIWRTA